MNKEAVPDTGVASTTSFSMSSSQMIMIGVIGLLLGLSLLGINVLTIFGMVLESINSFLGPFIEQTLGLAGKTAGTVINASADVASGTAKTGIDIADGAVHSIGSLLKNESNPDLVGPTHIDITINGNRLPSASDKVNIPEPDASESPIQAPITANKTSWCLVGEYAGRRGCVEVDNADKCMSGQVFPEQKMCLNPTLTQSGAV
jgi:hypothetical protein